MARASSTAGVRRVRLHALPLAVFWAANLRSRGSILAVAAFHSTFGIATTPTTTTMVPTLMGAVITVLALAVVPDLARTRRTDHPQIDRPRSFS